ncbi:hypothetical protein [Bdellovibrio bacteriovorus]|uniref:hypothetical protein n=1 Tax=Bdellovibrio TaxID=958 RepID=UPI0035A89C64
MKLFLVALATLFTSSAFAYNDGTYRCKTAVGVPDRIIKIQTQSFPGGAELPYVEITRFFRQNPNDQNSPYEGSTVKGFASVSYMKGREILMVAALRLDFVNNELQNCKK